MDDTLNGTVVPGDTAEPAPSRRLEIWLPVAIVALDQLSKAAIRATLPQHTSVTIVPGLVDFTHVRNTGAAFGILNTADFPFKTVVIAASTRRAWRTTSAPRGSASR
jgi:signal peptidase II